MNPTLRAWVQASRLPSQSYIALPLLLGQALALHHGAAWDWEVFVVVQLFGVFDQLYIVYANDYADRHTDAANETWTLFSGGSRVLAQGKLRASRLRRAAVLMACMSLLCGVALALGRGRWGAPALAATALLLLWMYSYSPVRLSYRGGGELLQMLGVGLVLPVLGFYAQAGALENFPWPLLATLLPLQLMCGMCTALPDEPSDRASHKRTTAVWMGPTWARAVIALLGACALLAFPLVSWLPAWSPQHLWMLSVPALAWLGMVAASPGARAGTTRVKVFVFLGILVNLSWMVGACLSLLWK
jgi:1,4-dihydroxy-2-naphthoate octaprenyltransferase